MQQQKSQRPSSLEKEAAGEAPAHLLCQKAENRPLEPAKAARAILRAEVGKCPRSSGWVVARDYSQAVAIRCKSWDCHHCSRFKQIACFGVLMRGIAETQADGGRVRFMTLTDGADAALDVAGLYSAWKRMAGRLRYRGLLDQYAFSVEVQKRGALHIHALVTGERKIPQAWLSQQAEAAGFGRIADIRQVPRTALRESIAAYTAPGAPKLEAAQTIARYCAKAGAEALRDKSAKRLRPFRVSRGWKGGGLRAAEDQLMREWFPSSGEGREWFFIPRGVPSPTTARLDALHSKAYANGGDVTALLAG